MMSWQSERLIWLRHQLAIRFSAAHDTTEATERLSQTRLTSHHIPTVYGCVVHIHVTRVFVALTLVPQFISPFHMYRSVYTNKHVLYAFTHISCVCVICFSAFHSISWFLTAQRRRFYYVIAHSSVNTTRIVVPLQCLSSHWRQYSLVRLISCSLLLTIGSCEIFKFSTCSVNIFVLCWNAESAASSQQQKETSSFSVF